MDYKGIYIYPTDTVWGIGASIEDEEKVNLIHKFKGYTDKRCSSILFSSLDEIDDYFTLPAEISKEWLKKIFSLESSLGVPLSFLKKDIGSWIYLDSHFVSIRFIDEPCIKEMVSSVGTPMTTTSLNFKGEAPIIQKSKARDFLKKLKGAHFIDGDMELSGQASTILELCDDNEKKINFIRKGRYYREIKACFNS